MSGVKKTVLKNSRHSVFSLPSPKVTKGKSVFFPLVYLPFIVLSYPYFFSFALSEAASRTCGIKMGDSAQIIDTVSINPVIIISFNKYKLFVVTKEER